MIFPAKVYNMAGKEKEMQTVANEINEEKPETCKRKLDGIDESPAAKVLKRSGYIEWDNYFMAVAFLSAQRSKDPNSQVGACIVNEEKKIVGIGYNGMPNGCSDDKLPWARDADKTLDTKYPYVCHAEMNAIMNKNSFSVKGCTMYVALFPCNECAKLIIQAGIKKIIYLSDKYHDREYVIASKTLLDMAKVEYVKFKPKDKTILIDFDSIEEPLRPSPSKLTCKGQSGF